MATLEELCRLIDDLRLEVQVLKEEVSGGKKSKDHCQGITGKGTQCRNGAIKGECYCKMHIKKKNEVEVEVEVEVKKKNKEKVKPLKKTHPEHDHPIGVKSSTCVLCDTHGDVWDPGLPDCCWEVVET